MHFTTLNRTFVSHTNGCYGWWSCTATTYRADGL